MWDNYAYYLMYVAYNHTKACPLAPTQIYIFPISVADLTYPNLASVCSERDKLLGGSPGNPATKWMLSILLGVHGKHLIIWKRPNRVDRASIWEMAGAVLTLRGHEVKSPRIQQK